MGALLDRRATDALVATFFEQDPRPVRRQPRGGSMIALRRRFAAVPLISDALSVGKRLRAGMPGDHGAGATRLLWRLAVLGSLHEAIVDGALAVGRSVPPGQV